MTAGFLLGLIGIGYAADKGAIQVAIDGSRNAVVRYTTNSTAPGYTGTIDSAGDLSKGLSTMSGDVKLSPADQKSVADSQALFYASVGSTNEVVGNMDLVLHQEKDKPSLQALDIDVQGGLDGSQSSVKGTLSLGATAPAAMPPFAVNGTAQGSGKLLDSNLKLSVDLKEAASQVPFQELKVDMTEVQNVTTLAVSAKCASASQWAGGLRFLGKNPEMVKTQVTQIMGKTGIELQKVELAEFKDGPDGVSGKITVAIKEWRSVARVGASLWINNSAMKIDKDKVLAGISELLESRFDNFSLRLKMDKSTLNASLDSKIEKVTELMLGYEDVVSAVLLEQLKQPGHRTPMQNLSLAWQQVNMEHSRQMIQVMGDSGLGVNLKGQLNLVPGAADAKSPKNPVPFNVTGDVSANLDHIKDFLSKAQAAHLAMPQRASQKLTVHLGANGRLGGTLYGSSDLNFFDFYRELAGEVAAKAGASPDTVKLVEAVQVKEGQLTGKLDKGEVSFVGFSEASNLVPAASAAFRGFSQGVSADVTGFHTSSKLDGTTNKSEFVLNLSKFMEGKTAADVKKFFPADTVVKEKASPQEVQLTAVTKPEVTLPAGLVAVEAEGKKLSGSSGLAGAVGGQNKQVLLMLGGGLVLVLAGLSVAAGRKKAG